MKSKKQCLVAVLAGTVILAGLVGCAHEVTASAGAPLARWVNVTATVATTDDEAQFELSEDSSCEACHTAEVASTEDAGCLAGDPAHESLECVDCHTFDKSLEKAHSGINAKSKTKDKLKKTEVTDESCLECHSYEELIANTPAEGMLVDKNGTAVNPHDVQALGGSHSDLVCTDCHVAHKDANVDETAYMTCVECHHADVFECGTCH